ncbi:MAG: hypothetical protein M3N31_00520 [Actinomycetota bacterium]|nr:hypothetical protein [Actinomycetota bacterium]
MPAWRRYAGTLYGAAGSGLAAAMDRGFPTIIISGSYGIVVAAEPIGVYDRRFALTDWPEALLSDCLLATAERLGVDHVVAFCSYSTGYAKLVRRVPWRRQQIEAVLLAPDMGGGGGAQVFVPRASGEALAAFVEGGLSSTWTSSDGVPIRVETQS